MDSTSFQAVIDSPPDSMSSYVLISDPIATTTTTTPEPRGNEALVLPTVTDPSVIVGMACRVPGANSPAKLWEVLEEQKDLRQKMPKNRFNIDSFYHPEGTNKGTTNTTYGYFLDQDISLFDNEFFHISGKEAESMDPQQRLTLEVVYEALEDAGITLEQIQGTQTSVYCGSFTNDYNSMLTKDLEQYPQHTVIGTANSILANRISYFYNLHGPSMTIDTACSSSLVCFHLGNGSLQSKESDISIIIGSALHFAPNSFITFTDFGMLSADGRCRSFDAVGSGYARGEGICVIILKRRSSAEAAGDTIRAIVRGTGSNHDGSKDGITFPNGKAQAELLRSTYKAAGLSTHDTLLFESHGTGTKAGDPCEANAIGSVFAEGRDHPLIVGSIKSNLGHLEGASGLAGIIKATLSLEYGRIMPNMHFKTPNPAIDFEKLKIEVPTKVLEWNSQVRRASVNSFGFGGSNAHIILENYHSDALPKIPGFQPPDGPNTTSRPFLVPLVSHVEKAGKLHTAKIVAFLKQNTIVRVADLAHSYSSRRNFHGHRSFAIGNNCESMIQDLTEPKPIAKWIRTLGYKPRVGFVFTGQGAQWHAMGRQLIEQSNLFKKTLKRCDEILQSLPDSPDWLCVEELLKPAEASRLSQSLFSQPVCTALQLAIVDLLRTWGVTPSAVVGHSSGEIGAAYCAGVLSFENAIICAYYRGVYMSKRLEASVRGAMIAVGLTESEGTAELKAYHGRIAMAAINSPSNLTLSGDEDAILELKQSFEERKIFVRQLKVEQAFHSHHMVHLAPAFERALSAIKSFKSSKSKVRMISSVTMRDSDAVEMDAAYWAANMTSEVRFSDALTEILLDERDEKSVDVLVEIGPHPVLRAPSKQILKSLNMDIPYLSSLIRDAPAYEAILSTVGQLFAMGYPVDLVAVNSDHFITDTGHISRVALGKPIKDLPTYSWNHSKFWAETRIIKEHRLRKFRHTVLGTPVPSAPENHPQWRRYLRQAELPWLSHHVVDGSVIFPAAGFICMALEAISTLGFEFKSILIRNVVFKAVLNISASEVGTEVMLSLSPVVTSSKNSSATWHRFIICSFDDNYRTTEHCHGEISLQSGTPAILRASRAEEGFSELQKTTTRGKHPATYYKQLSKIGLAYGESFRLLSGDIESGLGLAIAPINFRSRTVSSTLADDCILHPTFLDSAFHVIFAAIESQLGRSLYEGFIPTFIRNMAVSGLLNEKKHLKDEQKFWVKTNTKLPGSRIATSQLSIMSNLSNDVLVDVDGLEITALGNSSQANEERNLFFRIRWMKAFELLGSNGSTPKLEDLADVMDLFAHQFPNSKILHLTSSVESTKKALKYLGGRQSQQRRFQSITLYSRSLSIIESASQLESEWAGLVDFQKPNNNFYDIIVVSEPIDYNILPFLKTDGFVISENAMVSNGDPCFEEIKASQVTQIFKSPGYSCWKNSTKPNFIHQDSLTLLLSPTPSADVEALAISIESNFPGATTRLAITEFLHSPPVTKDIISLVSLDEDLFLDIPDDHEDRYLSVQKLLTSAGKNIVWLLDGTSYKTVNPAQAIMLGLLRTARNENERTRFVTLNLAPDYAISRSSIAAIELLNTSLAENEITEYQGALLIPRLETHKELNSKLSHRGQRQPQLEPFHQNRKLTLKIDKVGVLDTLVFDDDEDAFLPDLGDDCIEIEVRASAINSRDISAAIGTVDDCVLGDECAGVVTRIGRNISECDFRPGDKVCALRPGKGAHRSMVRSPAILCHKIGNMAFSTAASLMVASTTAYFALIDSARLRPGEFCLVHTGAGGVGQMAIQLAQMVGAHVIATVGSQSKRDFLKEKYGLTDNMIFNSRDDSFVSGVMKVTNGRGCDVAISSLAGELLHATWTCIAPFGRMIDIGKRDIYENSKLNMDSFTKNVSYASVDLVTLFDLNKPLLARVLRDCFKLVTDGIITPPFPIKEVPYSEARNGFRLLQTGDYFGKVILVSHDSNLVPVVPPTYRDQVLFDPVKVYLLVGGLGGIGRALAQWAFRRGARRLAFMSRSGAGREDAKTTIDWLTIRNVDVSVFAADVTNANAVQKCISTIGIDLAGVFHVAMVLLDAPLAEMTYDEWKTCLYPKVHGAYNLDKALGNQKLDFYVCFSSIAALVGGMGQANYAAANTYLDALMLNRRSRGLAGSSMNIGLIRDIGFVAENKTLEKLVDRTGYDTISEEELFYQVEEAVLQKPGSCDAEDQGVQPQLITGINLLRKDMSWAANSIFRNLFENLDAGASKTAKISGTRNILFELESTSSLEERTNLLMDAFTKKVASVLAVSPDSIHPKNSLSTYGLDSILAVEFRKWFSKTVLVELALFDILGAQSIEALVAKVAKMITSSSRHTNGDLSTEPDQAKKEPTADSLLSSPSSILLQELTVVQKPIKLPLSTYQSRMWFLHNLLDDPASLNLTITIFLTGRPNIVFLQKATDELARRNDIFRTSYSEGNEFSEQVVQSDFTIRIGYTDVSLNVLPRYSLEQHTRAMRSIPMDIENGETMRVNLIKLDKDNFALAFIIHHISLDNGSGKTFMTQLISLYTNLRNGKATSSVPSPGISYSDFTIWHNNRMQSAELSSDLEWWKKTFSGAPAASKLLPFAQAQHRSNTGTFRAQLSDTLEAPLLTRMKRICGRMEVTPFQFLLTALRAFIYRYTEEDDLTILMADGARPHPELDDIIGFFVNLIPLRCKADCESTFVNLLAEIKPIVLEAMKHSRIPFDVIVDAVNVERNQGYFPMGQIIVNYQMHGRSHNYQTPDFEVADFVVEDIPTPCEIALEAIEDSESGLKLRFEYDAFLYNGKDMERFFENFLVFLKNVIKDHRQPIKEVEMVGPKELEYLQTKLWNTDLRPNVWNYETIMSRILNHSKSTPNAIAIRASNGDTISYRDLVWKAEQIARSLQDLGILLGENIGVFSNPNIDMIATIMGIVYNGSCYVPMDPKFAKLRLHHMANDSNPSIIMVGEGLYDMANEIWREEQRLLSIPFALTTIEPAIYTEAVASDPFWIIYTSGTSGKPKGVTITHENAQSLLACWNSRLNINSQDTILFSSSLCFDMSVIQTWSALSSGATIALAMSDTKQDPAQTANFMKEAAVTVTCLTPTQLALLIEHNPADLQNCSHYRFCIMGGEVVSPRLLKSFYDLNTPATVANIWGTTETTVLITFCALPYPGLSDSKLPVGFPLDNCSCYIVDNNLKPVPAAVIGELCVGGIQVSSGYLNRLEATKLSFVEDAFASEGFQSHGWTTLYRTGDKARFLPSGELDFICRISGDTQIKLRGYRIDLVEVENEIYAASDHLQEKIANIIVMLRSLAGGVELTDSRQLIAIIVPSKRFTAPEQTQFVGKVHAIIKNTLNEYMLPSAYHFMDTIATMVSGKVDRRALLETELKLVFPSRSTETILGSMEASVLSINTILPTVTKIFKDVLKLDDDQMIVPDDNFFDLGGQSILLLRLRTALKRELKVDIPLLELFEISTPLGITQRIANNAQSTSEVDTDSLENHDKIDWIKETSLPNIRKYYPKSHESSPPTAIKQILLIFGADLFVGVQMLATILTMMPDTIIHVLGTQSQLTSSNLLKSFKQWTFFEKEDILTSRVRYVQGNLSTSQFGLSHQDFAELGRNIQAIYHAGGSVSLLQTYSSLRGPNVLSALDIIELASYGTPTASIHYLSTWSVVHGQTWTDAKRTLLNVNIKESSPKHFEPGSGNRLGFFKSRWAAEMIFDHAARRGFPVTIYRSSAITAPPGLAIPEDNIMQNLVVDMISLGRIPDLDRGGPSFSIDVIPIDYLTSTVVRLSNLPSSKSKNLEAQYYHIKNPSPLELSDLADLLPEIRDDGKSGEIVSLSEWKKAMDGREAVKENSQIVWMALRECLDMGHTMFSLDDKGTRKAMERSGGKLDCPPIDVEFLKDMLKRRGRG